MRALRATIAALLVLGLVGCGSVKELTMPDVIGKQLDVAKSDIERAGFKDKVEVIGGGVLGIFVESNWKVCEQLPAAGAVISDTPRLIIDRSCDDPTAEPSETPAATPTPQVTTTAEATPSTETRVKDITVDQLLDKLNAGKEKVGEQYRLTGTLFMSELWMTGASGDYFVMLRAKGGKQDLTVFVEESNADEWDDGTKVEMVVEVVKITIGDETSGGWLRAISVKTLS